MPSYDDGIVDVDNEPFIRQLAELLAESDTNELSEIYSLPACRVCFYHLHNPYVNVVSNKRYGKRNSELINSLLSLPKKLNDAGK
ncbi:AAEL001754-PA [Aedes aegypti]|nr:AAEL001754-PA [Aedes aegypti]